MAWIRVFLLSVILLVHVTGLQAQEQPPATIVTTQEKPEEAKDNAIVKTEPEVSQEMVLPEKPLPKVQDKDLAASAQDEAKEKKSDQEQGPKPPFSKWENTEDHLACVPNLIVEPEVNNPNPIRKGNNLMRKAGGAVRAGGNYIQITGRVIDENCLPIQGAVIQIWQADSLGNFEWEYDKKSYWQQQLSGKDKNFLFSGTAQTDNLGQFSLYTIFPGTKGNNAPHINFTVKREGYQEMRTRMYFAEHPKNEEDPILKAVEAADKLGLIAKGTKLDPSGKYEGRIYYFDITMRGINAYKRY